MKGKIVLVPFPFDDLSASKVRPGELGALSPDLLQEVMARLKTLFGL